jgi:hypothetical protein
LEDGEWRKIHKGKPKSALIFDEKSLKFNPNWRKVLIVFCRKTQSFDRFLQKNAKFLFFSVETRKILMQKDVKMRWYSTE